MESYNFASYDEAIEKLQSMKKDGKNGKVTIFTIDFDNDTESKKVATTEEGCVLVRRSKTVIINEDTFIPHIQLFSKQQRSIENIIKEGIMHDVILGEVRLE